MTICIATKVNDGRIHLFFVIAGFAGGHKVLSPTEYEAWKRTVAWEWCRDVHGRPITPPWVGPGNPGHPNLLSHTVSAEGECQLCRIIRKTRRPPLPRVKPVNKLKDPREMDTCKDRPGVLYLTRRHEGKKGEGKAWWIIAGLFVTLLGDHVRFG